MLVQWKNFRDMEKGKKKWKEGCDCWVILLRGDESAYETGYIENYDRLETKETRMRRDTSKINEGRKKDQTLEERSHTRKINYLSVLYHKLCKYLY